MSTKNVPKSACCFAIGEVQVESNGENATSAKFRMVARSGKPIDHPYWGRIVHDIDGFSVSRGRVAIDYGHDAAKPIGYANRFETDTGDLVASGALTPVAEDDAASRVLKQAAAGIPFEASINFGGTGVEIEQVEENTTTMVNGYEFAGPGVVVRKWPLRGIAVCLYGADQYTSTEFSKSEDVAVTFIEEESAMAATDKVDVFAANAAVIEADLEDEKTAVEPEVEAVEAEAVEEEADEDKQVEGEAVEAEAVETSVKELGARYVHLFGLEKGSQYFTLGLSIEQATEKHLLELQEENEQLRKRLAVQPEAGEDELQFTPTKPPKKKELAITVPEELI